MSTFLSGYSVGPLLYCPATNSTVADSIINGKFGTSFSLALCLEDTINDNGVEEAENTLLGILNTLANHFNHKEFYLPKIFIRVRNPEQISKLYIRLKNSQSILTGFVIPKFNLENANSYINQIIEINLISKSPIYMMPIFEDPSIIHLKYRQDILYGLKDKLDQVCDLVLNVRVGGNDFCHTFGFRRQNTESIYDIKPIANILSDIITVFGLDYVVSGPVWEYYDGHNWDKGLENELRLDRLNGFVGKTVIHPKQILFVNNAFMVSKADYNDAVDILNWDIGNQVLVAGSRANDRMNEYKTHYNWAKKIVAFYQNYGVLI